MSLYKQLWLAVIFLLTLVFVGSVIVTSLSAKTYLQQQLSMKNSDNATALALSLTQQDADEVLLELTLSAQFDTGFYELIQLTDPEGVVTITNSRINDIRILGTSMLSFLLVMALIGTGWVIKLQIFLLFLIVSSIVSIVAGAFWFRDITAGTCKLKLGSEVVNSLLEKTAT